MLSKDNIELHFATNHLGHFLLTDLLLDIMKKTAQESNREGRIINVSSISHWWPYGEGIRFDKINYHCSGYESSFAYIRSKLANVLHANELARRLKEDRVEITANSLHPGIVLTNIFREDGFLNVILGFVGKYMFKNVHQVLLYLQKKEIKFDIMWGSNNMLCALHPQVKGKSGLYFSECKIAQQGSHAADTELATKLWDFSLDLVKKCSQNS
ncbi:NAD(P)-binding Rossmann-fold superfamily protein [Citrus sinensis]|uniref:NAD(P)-binding Rossmann-fold superfamily protein n=1 Tax=Citrus sinensis TaxID=2711 RepID=A0ACB8HSD8_CITSI|nr:NAD(P)-binding Rossmann-fold superfamily protein [Citrus sinensis]